MEKSKGQIAAQYFHEGYNCAQSVVLAFIDEIGMTKEDALKMSSSFGGGMGRLREVCGAVTGAFMALGMIKGYTSPTDSAGKTAQYARVQAFAKKFEAANGSIVCRDLLELKKNEKNNAQPDARTNEYYKVRPCIGLVEFSADLLSEFLKEEDSRS